MIQCRCGSGRAIEACCIPDTYPICDEEAGWRTFRFEMAGVDGLGRLVPVPKSLEATISINQPHHLDESIDEALEPFRKALKRKTQLLPPDALLPALNSISSLENSLSDGLYAARYHQRQFSRRYVVVDAHHRASKTSGSGQLQVAINDLPMRCELEAFLLRARGSLDALAQFLGTLLLREGCTFVQLLKRMEKKAAMSRPLRDELQTILREQQSWIDESRRYRDGIVHEATFEDFCVPTLGVHGISSAAVATNTADRFVIRLWGQLIGLVRRVNEILDKHSSEWRLPTA
jgi:hypothetical protein